MPKILLVTVTKTEAQAVFTAFSKAASAPRVRQYISDKTYYALGVFGGAEVFMVQSEMGAVGPGAATLTIHKAIEDLHPTAIIMLGIAFGIRPDKQNMGEILVSKQIMTYEPQKRKGAQIIPRGDRATCSTWLLGKFRSGDIDWPGAKVHFGLILSGEKLIADQRCRDALLKLEHEAIGGEMEGAGLYTAASEAKTDWILVKAICDWADGNKNDTAQPLAAKNAADFVRHVIGLGGWDRMEKEQDMPKNNIQQEADDNATQIGNARDVNTHSAPVHNTQGGVHAWRDAIQGNQTNIVFDKNGADVAVDGGFKKVINVIQDRNVSPIIALVAIIAIFAMITLAILFMWKSSPSPTSTFTSTSTLTQASTPTPTPPFTPTPSFTPTPTETYTPLPTETPTPLPTATPQRLAISDWACWVLRYDGQGKPYGKQVSPNAQNKLTFTIDFSSAAEHKGQIFYTLGNGGNPQCSSFRPAFTLLPPDATLSVDIRIFEEIANVQAEIFLQERDPQTGDYGAWYAGRNAEQAPTDLNPGSLTTVRAVQWGTGNPPVFSNWAAGQGFIALGIEFKIKEGAAIPAGPVTFEIMPVEVSIP